MSRLTSFVVVIALAVLTVSQISSAEDLYPQIKVTKAEVVHINPKYTESLTFKINKHNATYNTLSVDWNVAEDIPQDTVVTMEVYTTNSNYQDEKLLLKESIPLCKESAKRNLLPLSLILPKSRLEACVKKGPHSTSNAGSFRFEVEKPNIHEISDYHYIKYILQSQKETIIEAKLYSEWGYLNQ